MKSIVIAIVAFAALNLSHAQDDGQYRPELYGADDGRYRPNQDGRYVGKYASIYDAYKPLYFTTYSRPIQQVVIRNNRVFQGDRNNIDQDPFATSLSAAVASTPSPATQFVGLPVYARAHQYTNDRYARILRQDQDLDVNAYHYLYQTENGISAEETGRVDPSASNSGTKATGFYEYVGDDGVTYRVDYVADENGFQPRGAHLPRV